jgi:hypothetical protein
VKNLQQSKRTIHLGEAIGARIAIIQHLIKVDSCICGDSKWIASAAYSFSASQRIKNADL